MEQWKKDLIKQTKENPVRKSDAVICQYCNQPAKLVGGDYIYPHRTDLFDKKFWQCANGHEESYVGCHPNTSTPLGCLANAELRQAKKETHKVFDPIWREKFASRGAAYRWLASAMKIRVKDCHMGMFTVEQCKQAALIATHELTYLRNAQATGYTAELRPIKKNEDNSNGY